jgi:hypothetical protein
MFAAQNEQDFLCRVFGDCLVGDELDREIGDMIGKSGPINPKLFTYTRYNAELSEQGLSNLGLSNIAHQDVQKMDAVKSIPELQDIGRAIGEHQVKSEHFQKFL